MIPTRSTVNTVSADRTSAATERHADAVHRSVGTERHPRGAAGDGAGLGVDRHGDDPSGASIGVLDRDPIRTYREGTH